MTPILRTSERSDFNRCPQRWWWAWREGLRVKGSEADALWFGSGIHAALAAWYCGPGTKRGPHPAETWAQWADEDIRTIRTVEQWDEEQEAVWVDAKQLGTVMMEEYVKLYGRDEHKLVLSPEMTFSLDVPWPSDQQLYPDWTPDDDGTSNLLVRYVGTFDSVWRHADTGHIWLDEHKTAGQIATGHLTLDPQAGSYWAVAGRYLRKAGLIGPKEDLWGIEYNFMRKALPDDRPKDAEGFATNKPTKAHYTDQLSTWLAETPEGRANAVPTSPPLGRMKLDELQALASRWGVTVIGERSKVQPAENFLRYPVHRTRPERNQQLIRLQGEALRMEAYRAGVLPVTKSPERTCNMGAYRCPFFEMCELHEAGGESAIKDFKRTAFVVRDPYADHR